MTTQIRLGVASRRWSVTAGPSDTPPDHPPESQCRTITLDPNQMHGEANGYEAIANDFTRVQDRSIGARHVRSWAQRLPPGATVLNVACGNGVPISAALLEMGFVVYGIDPSPTMLARFRQRFPDAPLECSPIEELSHFHRTFDAVFSWGLLFLLPAELQPIARFAGALAPGGHLPFTSPRLPISWLDGMTDLPTVSLGHDGHVAELEANGLTLTGNDEGDNYHFFATHRKTAVHK